MRCRSDRVTGAAAAALRVLLGVLVLGARGPLGPPGAMAAPAAVDVDEVVGKVQSTCSRVQDLTARFHQTATNRSLGQIQEASGLFLMKRPGKMRWEYQKPEARLFVTDGKTLWVYSPADKQVVVQDVGDAFASRMPLTFLAGDCQLHREFTVTAVDNAATRASPTTKILDLKPVRDAAGIVRLLLEVNLQTYTVERTTLFDAAGNTTVIAFANLKLNTGLSDQQFQFTPPSGVTVVAPPKR